MIKSMTGYGNAVCMLEGNKITVEMKSVNHRYNDISVKTPRIYSFLEEPIRTRLSQVISRGKVDVYVGVETYSDEDKEVLINEGLARGYFNALQNLKEQFGLKDDISVSSLSRFSDIFKIDRKDMDQDAYVSSFMQIFDQAAEQFVNMRIREGEKLKADMLERIAVIRKDVEQIRARAPMIVKEYQTRMEARMKELLENVPYDETRLLTEVAIFSEHVDTNEELVRLSSHLEQITDMLNLDEPIGRKLDFIIQELNREINTIGSKSNDLETAKYVVEVKSEIEKMREQAQNIE